MKDKKSFCGEFCHYYEQNFVVIVFLQKLCDFKMDVAVTLWLNRGFTILPTKNLAVNLRLNQGFTILHTKNLAINLWLNFPFVITVNIF